MFEYKSNFELCNKLITEKNKEIILKDSDKLPIQTTLNLTLPTNEG